MREIKFKAQRLDGRGWAVGLLNQYQGQLFITQEIIEHPTHSDPSGAWIYNEYEVNPKTVCQYIQTRKDMDIFKGDIVIVQGTKRIGLYETEIIETVQGFTLKENKTNLNDDKSFIAIKQVIGNIHDL